MTNTAKTAVYLAVAILMVLLTWATTPKVQIPAVFADRGELFFPEFSDPNAASSLEVVEFDEQNGVIRPLKVVNRSGRWTIPSHHDYPADAKDRLAQTAAAVIALRKDGVASDSSSDHERCGVLDPVDLTLPTSQGRGTRLTIRGADERLLADIIIGKPADGHRDFRFVRVPGQKRVYLSRVDDLRISTAFGDWIERDLLQVDANSIDAINALNYSLDESTGRLRPGDVLLLEKKDEEWTLAGLQPGEQLDQSGVNRLVSNLVGLKIVGVLPKPSGLSATVSQQSTEAGIAAEDRADLARKGFYLAADGRLLSNDGEMVVRATNGIVYTLRFGEVAPGTPEATGPPTAPPSAADRPEQRPIGRENRYLFIMAAFDSNSARPARRSAPGADKRPLLRARFAPWYYIISADSFASIRVQRKDLVKPIQPNRAPSSRTESQNKPSV